MTGKPEIEVLARGVCVKRGRVLLCRTKGADHTYLPGGHVEFMEGAAASLAREVEEELGRRAKVGRFLGMVEHTYARRGVRFCEINLVFQAKIAGLDPDCAPAACEDYIEFCWAPLESLAAARLEPAVLCTLLPGWLRADAGPERWGSTYGNAE